VSRRTVPRASFPVSACNPVDVYWLVASTFVPGMAGLGACGNGHGNEAYLSAKRRLRFGRSVEGGSRGHDFMPILAATLQKWGSSLEIRFCQASGARRNGRLHSYPSEYQYSANEPQVSAVRLQTTLEVVKAARLSPTTPMKDTVNM